MNGFRTNLTDKILGTYAHITVLHQNAQGLSHYGEVQKRIENVSHVLSSSPFVYGQIMLKHQQNTLGAVVKGIIPEDESRTTKLRDNITAGKLDTLCEGKNVILGREISKNLGVRIGDEIFLIFPSGVISSFSRRPGR